MRILGIYAEDYPWDVRIDKIMMGLASIGFESHLLCRNLRNRAADEKLDGLTCHRILAPQRSRRLQSLLSLPIPGNPFWLRRLEALISRISPSLIVVRDVPLSDLAIRTGRRHKVPVIVDMAENHPAMWMNVVRNDPFPPRSWLLKNPTVGRWLERRAVTGADAIFVVVDEMRNHLIRIGCPADRIYVVSNTPRRAILTIEADASSGGGELDVVYVGNITASRGLQDMLFALHGINSSTPRIRFHVVGNGPYLDRLRKIAESLALGDRVVFHGWVANPRIPELIANCNVGLIPHRRTEHTDTTIPNKIFDYMAVALPVVVSDAAPLKRITETEKCGVVYRSGDPVSLSDALAALRDPDVRLRLGAAGRRAVVARYHWERDFETVTRAIGRLLPGNANVDPNNDGQ